MGGANHETQRQERALTGGNTGGPPLQVRDWYGPLQVMNALVMAYGDEHQKDVWGVGHFGKFEG